MSEYIRGAGPLRSDPVDDDDRLDDEDHLNVDLTLNHLLEFHFLYIFF